MRLRLNQFVLTASDILSQIERHPELPALLQQATAECYQPPFPPISVVVCTRDRVHALRRCLEALQQVQYPDYEVIVVDGSSDGDTAAVVASTRFRHVHQPQTGLQHARNMGVEQCRYDIVAFVDDDAVPDPLWLAGLASAFRRSEAAAVTGLVLAAELWSPAQALYDGYGRMPRSFNAHTFDGSQMPASTRIDALQAGTGTNMAFRKSTLQRVGLFDMSLDAGAPSNGRGDLDMLHRVLAAGLKIRYEPAVLVWHYHWRDLAQLRRKLRRDERAHGAFLLKLLCGGSVALMDVLAYAVRDWLGRHLLMRLVAAGTRRLHFPVSLILAQCVGAMQAPWAYFKAQRSRPSNLSRSSL